MNKQFIKGYRDPKNIKQGHIGELEDCKHDLEDPLHPARATWICRLCKQDISLMYILYREAIEK